MGTYFQPQNVNEGCLDKISTTCDKTDEEIQEYIAIIRAWLAKQNHLPKDQDDKFLEALLNRNQFSLQLTKSNLDAYYLLRTTYPEFCLHDPFDPALAEMRKTDGFIPIMPLTKNNERVFVITLGESSETYMYMNLARNGFNTMDLLLHKDYYTSEIIVTDYRNWTISHSTRISLPVLLAVVKIYIELYATKLTKLCILSDSAYIGLLVRLLKVSFPHKYHNIIHLHRTLESLHQCVPKSNLPLELGGDLESIKVFEEKHETLLAQNRDFFVAQSTKISNEELRNNEVSENEYFGKVGSYRKYEAN